VAGFSSMKITLQNVSKNFGGVKAVNQIALKTCSRRGNNQLQEKKRLGEWIAD